MHRKQPPAQLLSRSHILRLWVLLVISMLWLPVAWAQESESPALESEASEEPNQELDLGWLDTIQDGVEDTVDATARWFDQFFGDSRSFDDTPGSRGRISVGPEWSEYEGWKVRTSLRAQFTLPNTEERFSAIIGRVDFDDFVTGEDTHRQGSVIRRETGNEEWIVGLGFDPSRGETSRFSVSAGIRGGLRADLYTQVRYLKQHRFNDYNQARSRTSLFWRNSDGFGINQRVDWENSPNQEWLNRVSVDVTRAERIAGYRWRSSVASYHIYAPERAMAVEYFWRGETKMEVPLRDHGFRIIHRRSWLRDWLFLETYGGLHWPRRELNEPRLGSYLLGFEIEMWFGD